MALNTSQGTPGDVNPNIGNFPNNHAYYMREFISIANPILIYDQFGSKTAIQRNSSNTIVYNKVEKLEKNVANRILAEGVPPTEQQFKLNRISKSVNQYGGFATTTDRLTEESINGITSQFNQRIAEQGGETMNLVVRDDLLGGTNVRFSAGAVDQDNTVSAPVAADFEYMFQGFRAEKVKYISSRTAGSGNTGTAPISSAYIVIVPTTATGLLEALDDGRGEKFTHVKDYGSQVSVYENEYGTFKNFRFILDTEASVVLNATSGKTVAQALVFGKDAYATTTIAGSDVQLFIKPLGSAGAKDPLNQFATIGWKAKKAAVIIQPTYMYRYEFALD